MSSTLRSLVLRYKADHKDFTRGNEQVKKELRQTREAVLSIDKDIKKSFAPGSIAGMRNEIKTLNQQFTAGRMDVKRYGDEVDRLKQKIASVQRVGSIRAHEVGAARTRAFKSAMAEKELRDSFRGTMEESRESIIARMSGGGGASAMGAAANAGMMAQLMGMKKWGVTGKLLGVAGPAAGLVGIGRAVGGRMSELGEGADSKILRGMGAVSGDVAKGTTHIAKEIATGFVDGLAGLVGGVGNAVTFGGVAAIGREAKREEAFKKQETELRNFGHEKKRLIDESASPVADFDRAQDIKNATEETLRLDIEDAKADRDRATSLDQVKSFTREIQELEAEIVNRKQEALALDQQAKRAAEAKKEAIGQTVQSMRDELKVQKLVSGGMTESAARLKVAGATDAQVNEAGRLERGIAREQQNRKEGQDKLEHLLSVPGRVADFGRGAVAAWKADVEAKAKERDQFAKQFDTPQEAFGRNLEEIGKMQGIGVKPEILKRAMQKNARDLALSGGQINPFGANVKSGSAEEQRLLHQARVGAGQTKQMDRLLQIQEEALRQLKENGEPINVNVIEQGI